MDYTKINGLCSDKSGLGSFYNSRRPDNQWSLFTDQFQILYLFLTSSKSISLS